MKKTVLRRYAERLAGAALVVAACHGFRAGSARAQASSVVLQGALEITHVRTAADGGLVVGARETAGDCVAKLDSAGALQWQVRPTDISDPAISLQIVDLAAMPDGGAVALLNARWQPCCGHLTRLARISPGGTMAWSASWSLPESGRPHAVAVLSDGAFAVLGRGTAVGTTITRRGASGEPSWSVALATMPDDGVLNPALAATGDGGVMVVMNLAEAGPWLVRLDAAGNIAWQRHLECDLVLPRAPALRVDAPCRSADGGWLLTGGGPVVGSSLWTARLDDAGTLEWARSYALASSPLSTAYAVTDIVPTSTGGAVIVAGDTSLTRFLVRLAQDGAPAGVTSIQNGRWRGSAPLGVTAADRAVLGMTIAADAAVVASLDERDAAAGCVVRDSTAIDAHDFSLRAAASFRVLATARPSEETLVVGQQPGALVAAPCPRACEPDSREDDDSSGLPSSVPRIPAVLAGNFCDDGEDWFFLRPCAGSTLLLETSALGAAADTILDLFTANRRTLLATDDDGGVDRGSRLAWPVTDAGGLLLRVRQADGSSGPDRDYVLNVDVVQPSLRTYMRRVGVIDPQTAAWRVGADGAVVGVGGTRDDMHAWLLRLDDQGVARWTVAFPGAPFARAACASPLADGGAVTAMRANEDRAMSPGTDIARIGPDGSVTWARRYVPDGTGSVNPASSVELVGGRMAVVGSQYVTRDGDTRAWVGVLDGSGALTWDKRFGARPGSAATDVSPSADGGLFACGQFGDTRSAEGFVARFRAAGVLSWARSLDARALAVASAADDGVFVLVSVGTLGVVRLDAAGNVAWTRVFQEESSAWLRVGALSPTADGGVLVVARLASGLLENVILRLDANGNTLWQRSLSPTAVGPQGGQAAELPGGDVVMAVDASMPDGMPSGVLVRMGPDGLLEAACRAFGVTHLPAVSPEITLIAADLAPEDGGGSLLAVDMEPHPLVTGLVDACSCSCRGTERAMEVSRAASRRPLRVHEPGRLTWEPLTYSGACSFNLYRGDVTGLRAGDHGSCLSTDMIHAEAWDLETPGIGRAWFYLVTGMTPAGEGPLGPDSLGRDRALASPCP